MEYYIGSAQVFPIQGRDEVGVSVVISVDSLAKAATERGDLPDELHIMILPMKAENVTDKKTHSVKLIKTK